MDDMAHRFTLARYDVEAVAPKGSTVWKYMRTMPENPDDQYGYFGAMVGFCWPAGQDGWADFDGGDIIEWGSTVADHMLSRGATFVEVSEAALISQAIGLELISGPTVEGIQEKEDFSEAPVEP